MARVKLEFPEPAVFSTVLVTRVDDINYGGHVGNERFLTFAQEARIRLFRKLGYPNEASIQGSTGIIVADAAIVYKAELFLGEKVGIELGIDEQAKFSFDFYYRMKNMDKNQVCAIVKTGIVGFDYSKGSIAEIPEEFYAAINSQ